MLGSAYQLNTDAIAILEAECRTTEIELAVKFGIDACAETRLLL